MRTGKREREGDRKPRVRVGRVGKSGGEVSNPLQPDWFSRESSDCVDIRAAASLASGSRNKVERRPGVPNDCGSVAAPVRR